MTSRVRPKIVSKISQTEFENQATNMGLDPDDLWVGGYVDYEWDHLRHILEAYDINVKGLRILEFGSNVGASAILLAYLGAEVTAIDIDEERIELGRVNARRYGISSIEFQHVADTRRLPFEDRHFDLVCCNSVLEYVDPSHLPIVQAEIDRTVKIGGKIMVTSTSNRLWPKEVHSSAWLVNYLPRFVDQFLELDLQRGLSPWKVRYGFGDHYANLDYSDKGKAFVNSRTLIGSPVRWLKLYARITTLLRIGPGLLARNISCVLLKRA